MSIFSRRDIVEPPASIDAELDRIRAIRVAAEEELGRLRKELTERVATVEKKERELADAIAKVSRGGMAPVPAGADEALAHAQVGLAARAQELNRRENDVATRERTLVREEAELARKTGAPDAEARLAQIEARLAAEHDPPGYRHRLRPGSSLHVSRSTPRRASHGSLLSSRTIALPLDASPIAISSFCYRSALYDQAAVWGFRQSAVAAAARIRGPFLRQALSASDGLDPCAGGDATTRPR